MSIKSLLEDEIKDQIEGISKMEMGSDEYKSSTDGVTKLVDKYVELKKFDAEVEKEQQELRFKEESRDLENQLKQEQLKADKRDRVIKNTLTATSIVSGIGVTVWGALKSWEFEKEGTVSSTVGRMFMQLLKFKK